ncbi:hypothetical protein [Candidatus Spongiihabitans sp.]|uniref:hypothetical protein n=1 Tax=Candidatus Spongiihabitans sp. TaxID=3101308 RepID=UPI003C7D7916
MNKQKGVRITYITKDGLLLIAQQTVQCGDTKNAPYVITAAKPPYLRWLKSPTQRNLAKNLPLIGTKRE